MKKARQGRGGPSSGMVAYVTAQIAELGAMSTAQLREKYEEVYGLPTRSRNRVYLHKKVAWKIQADADGGLSQRALDRIEKLAPLAPVRWTTALRDLPVPETAMAPAKERDPRLPPAGTVLTRRFKGTDHEVKVLEQAFVWDGQRYESLTAVAKAITGTHWNGYLFFGLAGSSKNEKR